MSLAAVTAGGGDLPERRAGPSPWSTLPAVGTSSRAKGSQIRALATSSPPLHQLDVHATPAHYGSLTVWSKLNASPPDLRFLEEVTGRGLGGARRLGAGR